MQERKAKPPWRHLLVHHGTPDQPWGQESFPSVVGNQWVLWSAETPGQHFWTPFLMAAACGSTGDEDNKLCSAPQEGVFKKGHLRRHALGLAVATCLKKPHNPSHITGDGWFFLSPEGFASIPWGWSRISIHQMGLEMAPAGAGFAVDNLQQPPPVFLPQPPTSNSTSSSRTSSLTFSQCPLACSGSTTWEDAPFYPVSMV